MSYADFDFHLHSQWSYDAVAPVEEYFRLARERGVCAIALTEHNNMDSFREVREVAGRYPEIGYLAGAEFTVRSEFGSTDMVCLNLPPEPGEELRDVLLRYRLWQREYGAAVSAALLDGGFPYDEAARAALLRRYRPEKALAVQGVTHVQGHLEVEYLVREKHYFASKDAYYDFRSRYSTPPYPEASSVLPAVKRAGGVVLIAHPAGYFRRNDLKRMDAMREVLGFDGIECAHPSIPAELTPFYRDYCLKHKLLSTAGSDSHSVAGQRYRFAPESELARHIGVPRWREEILERITVYHG